MTIGYDSAWNEISRAELKTYWTLFPSLICKAVDRYRHSGRVVCFLLNG